MAWAPDYTTVEDLAGYLDVGAEGMPEMSADQLALAIAGTQTVEQSLENAQNAWENAAT